MIFGLYARLAVVAAIAIFLAGTHWKAYTSGKAAVRAEWDRDIAERTTQALAAEQAARVKEGELQATADKLRRVKDAEITGLTVRVGELRKRLRDRPERPSASDVPPVAGTGGSGCSPSQLYRDDAEVAVQLAASADKLRIALQACYATYKAARAVK